MAADDAIAARMREAFTQFGEHSQHFATAGETGAAAWGMTVPPPGADALAQALARWGNTLTHDAPGSTEGLTPHTAAAMGSHPGTGGSSGGH